MNGRRGYALLSTLWFLMLLTGLMATGVSPLVFARRAGENRTHEVRARWAARSCLALTRARFANTGAVTALDSVALGPVVWCSTQSLDAWQRVNPNAGDSVGLNRFLGDSGQVAALLDWIDADDERRGGGSESASYASEARPSPRNGPIAAVAEIRMVLGFEHMRMEELEQFFTVWGDGAVSANEASLAVLGSVSVLSVRDASALLSRRGGGRRLDSPEQVVATLDLELTTAEFRELSRRLSFRDDERIIRSRGFVNIGSRTVEATLLAVMVKSPRALRVVHVEAR